MRHLLLLCLASSSLALHISYTSTHRPCGTLAQQTRQRLNQAPVMRESETVSYLSSSMAAWAELAKENPSAFALRIVILGSGLYFFATVALTLLQRAA